MFTDARSVVCTLTVASRCLQHPYLVSRGIEPEGLSPAESHQKLVSASAKLIMLQMLLRSSRSGLAAFYRTKRLSVDQMHMSAVVQSSINHSNGGTLQGEIQFRVREVDSGT